MRIRIDDDGKFSRGESRSLPSLNPIKQAFFNKHYGEFDYSVVFFGEEVTIEEALESTRCVKITDGFDHARYVFKNGVITICGDAIDYGYRHCYCMKTNGHDYWECEDKPCKGWG